MRLTRRVISAALALSLSACSTPSLDVPAPSRVESNALLNAEALFDLREVDPYQPEEHLLALDAQMRFFVQEQVPRVLSPRARLNYLLDAMVRPSQLGLEYEPGITLNARDTFYQRVGNCLSLSSLFIALAREAGLDAHYNEVTIPPSWEMISDNSMAFYQHINAVVYFEDGSQQVVDLSVDNYDYHYPQTRISEQRAAAQHYNNRAVEYLNRDDTATAYRYLRRALYLDPEAGHIWGNLGTVFRRDGHTGEAEVAYRKALSLNPKDQVASGNLGRLYRETDRDNQARSIEASSLAFQRQNPYWHYGRAKQDYEQGDFAGALRAVDRAISLDRQQPRFYQLQALIHQRLGDRKASLQSARRASLLRLKEN